MVGKIDRTLKQVVGKIKMVGKIDISPTGIVIADVCGRSIGLCLLQV